MITRCESCHARDVDAFDGPPHLCHECKPKREQLALEIERAAKGLVKILRAEGGTAYDVMERAVKLRGKLAKVKDWARSEGVEA
jgi:hypothetical protein